LLDFDVICGALPTMILQRCLDWQKRPAKEAALAGLVGPHTTNLLLSSLEEYSLPPGTAGELLRRLDKTKGGLSHGARQFLEVLHKSQKAPDPTTSILKGMSTVGSITDVLRGNLTTFASQLGDVRMLESVIERDTPFEDLMSGASESRNIDAFHTVYGYLGGERRGLTLNNLHDALNVAMSVRIFNSPSAGGTERKVPVLISQTGSITRFGHEAGWLSVDDCQDAPIFINNGLYLVVARGLLTRTDNDFGLAADFAGTLAERLDKLGEQYHRILHRYCRNIPPTVCEIGTLAESVPTHEWDLLQFMCTLLLNEWGDIFIPYSRITEFDRIELINTIINPRVKCLLEGRRPGDVRMGLKELEANLRCARQVFWEPLLEYADLAPLTPGVGEAFEYRIVTNDGRLLWDVGGGSLLDTAAELDTSSVHDIRVVVCPRYLNRGAMLAVDSWRSVSRMKPRNIGISWIVSREADLLLDELLRMLRAILETNGTCPKTCRCSFDTPCTRATKRISFDNPHSVLKNVLDGPERVDHIELRGGAITICADLAPLEEIEMQACLTLPESCWHSACVRPTADAISATSLIRLGTRHYEGFLSRMLAALNIGSEDTVR